MNSIIIYFLTICWLHPRLVCPSVSRLCCLTKSKAEYLFLFQYPAVMVMFERSSSEDNELLEDDDEIELEI